MSLSQTATSTSSALKKIEIVAREGLHRARMCAEADRKKQLSASIGPGRLSGFPVDASIVPIENPLLDRAVERITIANDFLARMDAFSTDLTMRGLPPIAVLPGVLWEHLTKAFGVYRFEHFGADSRVPAQPIAGLTRAYTKIAGMTTLVRALWPEKHDTLDSGLRIHPQFPAAPANFQQNLARLTQLRDQKLYPVCVAAVEEAIQVDRKEVLDAHREHGLLRVMQPTLEQDPILFTRDATGQLVAILDIYGEFAQEEVLVHFARTWYDKLERR